MKKFDCYRVSLELMAELVPIIGDIRRQHPSLAAQMDEALDSMVLNLKEGNRAHGRNRARFFGYSNTSAEEVEGGMDIAATRRLVSEQRLAKSRELLDRVFAMQYRLLHPRT